MYANVYTMIDCAEPGPEEKKEDEVARTARLNALYSKLESQTCGSRNAVEIDGSTIFTGYPKECMQACLAGNGGEQCHGFTYDTRKLRCTFVKDVLWGDHFQ